VLVNTEDMAVVARELRGKIMEKIRAWARTPTPSAQQERLVSMLIRLPPCHLVAFSCDQSSACAVPLRDPLCAMQVFSRCVGCSIRCANNKFPPSSLQFVHLLFEEVDQDGSGAIDKGEFRVLLKKLNLSYRSAAASLSFPFP
jgi:hypothetical protein